MNEALPVGLLGIIQGDSEEGEWLVQMKDIDMIGFTGSRETGSKIMASAASTLKPLVMEIGEEIGPIVSRKHRQRILNLIEDAVQKGAKVLYGDYKRSPDNYINPTILGDVNESMDIFNKEIFGPVICVNKYEDIEKSVKEMSDTGFGLGGVIFGEDGARELADKLNVGMVGINMGVGGLGDSPWVGANKSGYGYHGSADGHRQFTQVKVINSQIIGM